MIQHLRRGLRWIGGLAVRGWRHPGWVWLAVLGAIVLEPGVAHAATGSHTVLASTSTSPSSGIPTVNYNNSLATSPIVNKVNSGLAQIASIIRDFLGGTALVVFVSAAIMNHFVHNPQAKQLAKELVGAAIVGILIAIFAPDIVKFLTSL